MWRIDNGVIILQQEDAYICRPTAADIYAQKDENAYWFNGIEYPPLKNLKIRFSSLVAHPYVKITFADQISVHIIVEKNNKSFEVGISNNKFVDYIIIDNVWKYLDPSVISINKILNDCNLSPYNISYSQYVTLTRELLNLEIQLVDDVSQSVERITSTNGPIISTGLKAKLFPYQSSGCNWLDFMTSHRCGCILGDEMGLGKTLQIITVMGLLKERKSDSHFLVVCPISLLENWKREISKFYPSLSTLIHYGAHRTGDYRELLNFDVVIMPFSSTVADSGMLTMITWDLLIVDEAQNIKNPRAQRTLAVKNIKAVVPIAVTGTPFQNHMTDIWSLVDFILPGFLGNLNQFEKNFVDDIDSAVKLEKLISPIMLRRLVKDVATDLPERIDIPQPILMSDKEALLYEESRNSDALHKELQSMQLSKIQKLRTFCTHPCVYDNDYNEADPITISNKYCRLCEILEEIFESNEKVVIFTSFRKMIELLCDDLHKRFNVYTDFIDGSVPAERRQLIVDKFANYNGSGALILNPNAAGTGLNITCANHAIHYNLEWNPAVEDQASARIYRRGQIKTVFIHRLFYVGTIEEIINEKISHKRAISDSAIVGNKGNLTEKLYLIRALSASPFTE